MSRNLKSYLTVAEIKKLKAATAELEKTGKQLRNLLNKAREQVSEIDKLAHKGFMVWEDLCGSVHCEECHHRIHDDDDSPFFDLIESIDEYEDEVSDTVADAVDRIRFIVEDSVATTKGVRLN
jgi:hypothetical protein